MKNRKLMKLWSAEVIEAVTMTVKDEDLNIFKEFYARWYNEGIYDIDPAKLPDDHILMASVMKMAVNMNKISKPIKNKAIDWLYYNNFFQRRSDNEE